MKTKPAKYEIIGCDHRFVPTKETYKECNTCNLEITDNECLDDIKAGERCYAYRKYYED